MSAKLRLRGFPALILLLTAIVSANATAAPLAPVTPKSSSAAKGVVATPTLKGLLDDAKITYAKNQDSTSFRVTYADEKGTERTISLWEAPVGDDPGTRLICLATDVMALPKTPSSRFADRIAALNERMLLGRLTKSGTSLKYCSSLWLRTADARSIITEIQIAAQARAQAEADLQAYLK